MNPQDSWHRFDDYHLQRAVLALAWRQRDAVLNASTSSGRQRLYFRGGDLVFATSDATADRLSTVLIRRGVLSAQQYAQAEQHFSPSLSVGRNLLVLGLLSETELRESARAHVFSVFSGVMGAQRGAWAVRPGLPAQPITQTPMAMPQVWIRAILRWEDRAWVGARYQDRFDKVLDVHVTPRIRQWVTEVDPLGDRVCRELAKRIRLNDVIYAWPVEPFLVLRWVYIIDSLSRAFPVAHGENDGSGQAKCPPVRRRSS